MLAGRLSEPSSQGVYPGPLGHEAPEGTPSGLTTGNLSGGTPPFAPAALHRPFPRTCTPQYFFACVTLCICLSVHMRASLHASEHQYDTNAVKVAPNMHTL